MTQAQKGGADKSREAWLEGCWWLLSARRPPAWIPSKGFQKCCRHRERNQGGEKLWDMKAGAAIPDKRWALSRYGYENRTNESARYFILGMNCPDCAVPPRHSDLVLFWEE